MSVRPECRNASARSTTLSSWIEPSSFLTSNPVRQSFSPIDTCIGLILLIDASYICLSLVVGNSLQEQVSVTIRNLIPLAAGRRSRIISRQRCIGVVVEGVQLLL